MAMNKTNHVQFEQFQYIDRKLNIGSIKGLAPTRQKLANSP